MPEPCSSVKKINHLCKNDTFIIKLKDYILCHFFIYNYLFFDVSIKDENNSIVVA